MGWAGIEEEFRVQLHRLCSPPIGAHRFDDLQHRPTQCHRGLHVEQGRDWQVAQRQRGEHFPVQLVIEEGRIPQGWPQLVGAERRHWFRTHS